MLPPNEIGRSFELFSWMSFRRLAMHLVSDSGAVESAALAGDCSPRRRKESARAILERQAPHIAAALADQPDHLNRFDRRFSAASLDVFARTLDKAAAADFDTFLREAHDLYRHRKLLADAGLVLGRLPVADAGRIYAALADSVVKAVLRACDAEFIVRHGRVPGGRHALVALGKFGSREATATSDLDLVFVYELDDPSLSSDGAQPLTGVHYYCRLAQFVIASLGSNFGHGPMFEVDIGLRPWGIAGPIATRLAGLREYFAGEALTFEAMALTRARVIAGRTDFAVEIEAALRHAVMTTAQLRDVNSDVALVRELVQEKDASRRVWDIKCAAGGLMDIDFIIQGLMLLNAPTFAGRPMNDPQRAIAVLRRAKALPAVDARLLTEALRLYGSVMQLKEVSGQAEPRRMPAELVAVLASAADVDDVRSLERELRRTQREVQRVFAGVYGRPRRRDWIQRRAA
jgi:glutamate-ammonia-ligase adenylyltransferase